MIAVVAGLVATLLLYIFGTRAIAGQWPSDLSPIEGDVQFNTLRLVFAFVAGIGGVVALVISYRKQVDLEDRRFTDEFISAAKLMASPEITENLAGIHAMAAAINGTRDHSRRKQGVDQLCSYLRLETDPDRDQDLIEQTRTRQTAEGFEQAERYLYRRHEADMRRAVISVIADNRPVGEGTGRSGNWSDQVLRLSGANLRDAQFPGTDLSQADLRMADLAGANFREATLTDVDLIGADLRRANLTKADLSNAELIGAAMPETNLRESRLTDANLLAANLAGADLTGADLRKADLTEANLDQVEWDEKTMWPSGFTPPSER